ncbi:MAG: toll/interleukin-1 receptor domain-containing protein [Bryobacteraceae bacterium]|jgi:hypothetical protein
MSSEMRSNAGPIDVFMSYSHADEVLRDQLAKHLKPLEREGIITPWHDHRIAAGSEFEGEISDQLNHAGIILLLVSPDFIASEYSWRKEMTRALERHHAGDATVIPIVLRPVDWHNTPFGKLQALPRDGKPVSTWPNMDEAFLDVARGVRATASQLKSPPVGWTPRSYSAQTDFGALTGGQASIHIRAKVALDQSLPLLEGLYPLIPDVGAEDLAAVQAIVRTQFTALVNELGVVGGPRVPRVDQLFESILGAGSPANAEGIARSGSLGLLRRRFGLERRYVTTVEDEQNLTNYLILVDYWIGLKQSWDYNRSFFIRASGGMTERQPFFGTQLVLIARALDAVAQGVQDANYAMDSVFVGAAERQVAQLDFAGLTVFVPDPRMQRSVPYTFRPDMSGLFVAELLDWVYRSASGELRNLLIDGGKDGLASFLATTDRLRMFVRAAISPPQDAKGLPAGYHTPRVMGAMKLVADGLDQAYTLAFQVQPPEFPAGDGGGGANAPA